MHPLCQELFSFLQLARVCYGCLNTDAVLEPAQERATAHLLEAHRMDIRTVLM
jgi:hypothetical protein